MLSQSIHYVDRRVYQPPILFGGKLHPPKQTSPAAKFRLNEVIHNRVTRHPFDFCAHVNAIDFSNVSKPKRKLAKFALRFREGFE